MLIQVLAATAARAGNTVLFYNLPLLRFVLTISFSHIPWKLYSWIDEKSVIDIHSSTVLDNLFITSINSTPVVTVTA